MNLRGRLLPRLACFLLAASTAAACGTAVKTTVVNPAPRPMAPRPPATVELFTAGPPDRPRADVAIIEVEEQSSLSTADTADMMRALRAKAARMGCDGVVLGGASSRDPGLNDLETWITEEQKGRKGFYGTCIVYLPEPRPAARRPIVGPPVVELPGPRDRPPHAGSGPLRASAERASM